MMNEMVNQLVFNICMALIVALILNTALILFAIYYFIQMLHDPELQAQYSKILYQTYGITFKEFLDQLGLSSYAQ